MWEILYPIVHDVLNAFLIGMGGIFLAYLVTRFSTSLLARWLSKNWGRFLSSLIGLGILIWTAKIVMDSTSAEGFAVVLITALTAAVALGSSLVTEDLVAGISLFFATPFDVGDKVSLAGYNGKVAKISLFITTLENEAGDRIIIRNSEVTRNSIIKYAIGK